jgi:carbon-monoxide dehydrogenase medium subunit
MKPPVFEYRDPRSLGEALSLLNEHGDDSSILAGGQSLIPLLNLRLARPDFVIDINNVPGLDSIEVLPGCVRVGAMTRIRRLERDPQIRAVAPALADAFQNIAHPQIRSRTTIGGNISHADPSSELPGVLAAYDGRVQLTSAAGSRWVSWADFFVTVFTTTRESNELLTAVEFPTDQNFNYEFEEIARRPGDYPLAGVCAGISLEGGRVRAARLSAIAIADRPIRMTAAESALVGVDFSDPTARLAASQAAAAEINPMDDEHGSAAFRRGLVSTLVNRTLDRLAGVSS